MGGRRVLDLFCGAAGGWSHGVEQVGWRIVAAAESDPVRRAIYAQRHPGAVLYDDVRDVTAERPLADLGYLPDIVVGSPPCQDISGANPTGDGVDGARSGLFWEAVAIIDEVRPDWAALENSPRFRTKGCDPISGALEAIGYACWPCVVGVDDAGGNHGRDRVWLAAANTESLGLRRRLDPEASGRQRTKLGWGAAADAAGSAWQRIDGAASRGRSSEAGSGGDDAADAAGPGHQERPRARRPWRRLPPALRGIGDAWPHWNGGVAGLAASCAAARPDRVDDGVPARMAVRARNICIAAYGDAVVPEICRAIAAAIETTEREIATWR